MVFSIFIDSSTNNGCPGVTESPTDTFSLMIRPGIGALTTPSPPVVGTAGRATGCGVRFDGLGAAGIVDA